MKKSDIATLILIIAVVGTLVFVVLKFVLGTQTMQPVSVEVAKPIATDVIEPSAQVFNETAINPTVPITIEGGDQKPIGN